jgi:hypothetical protein
MDSPPVPCQLFSPKCHIEGGWEMTYVATGEVTTLEHELGNDAVEGRALVVERLARAAGTLLTSAESAEVLSSLRCSVSPNLRNLWSDTYLRRLVCKKLHHNAASGRTADGDIEEDVGVRHFDELSVVG